MASVGVNTFAASFVGDYADPVVIAGVPTHNGDEEIIVRITSVDTRTKTIQFCESPLLPAGPAYMYPYQDVNLIWGAVRQMLTRPTTRAKEPRAPPPSIRLRKWPG